MALDDRDSLLPAGDGEGVRVEANDMQFPALGALLCMLGDDIEYPSNFALDGVTVMLVFVQLHDRRAVARVQNEIRFRVLLIPLAAESDSRFSLEGCSRGSEEASEGLFLAFLSLLALFCVVASVVDLQFAFSPKALAAGLANVGSDTFVDDTSMSLHIELETEL